MQEGTSSTHPRAATPGRAALMLVLVTLFWSASFPLVKLWTQATPEPVYPSGFLVQGLTIVGLRTVGALMFLAAWRPWLFTLPSRREHAIGLTVGAVNCLGSIVQTWGLAHTSPAVSGFLTSLGSAWVPVLAFVAFRERIALLMVLGLAVGVAGAAVLGIEDVSELRLGLGERLTIASTFAFASVILLLDRLGRGARPGHLTVGFVAGTGLPALVGAVGWAMASPHEPEWRDWVVRSLADPWVQGALVTLAVFPTVLSLHWMGVYQPLVPATRAALIYLLEPVFVAVLSVLVGYDRVTPRLLLGGGLILGGNLVVELLPVWLRRRTAANAGRSESYGAEGDGRGLLPPGEVGNAPTPPT